MPSVTTEGLILKRSNFGEADKVLTVLTDRYGKISVIARGVRKITSRRAGNIELLNRVKLHVFKGKGYTLQEAESIETFQKIKANLTLSTFSFHIIELVDRLTREGEKNINLYNLVVAALKSLQENPRQIFIRAFEVKLISLLGFATFQDDTFEVSRQTRLTTFDVVSTRKNIRILELQDVDGNIKKLLAKLESSSWEDIAKMEINSQQAVALESFLRYYLERILEAKLKSVEVIGKLRS